MTVLLLNPATISSVMTRRPLLPARAKALRMKWIRHRCQVALKTLATDALMPSWAFEVTSFTPLRQSGFFLIPYPAFKRPRSRSWHQRRYDVNLLCVIAHKWGTWGWWFPKNRREARHCLRCKVVQVRAIAKAPAAQNQAYCEGQASEASTDNPAPNHGPWTSRSACAPRRKVSASEHR